MEQLSAEDKLRIQKDVERQEYRMMIRRQLKNKSKNKVWELLNSPFVIWLLTMLTLYFVFFAK